MRMEDAFLQDIAADPDCGFEEKGWRMTNGGMKRCGGLEQSQRRHDQRRVTCCRSMRITPS